MQALEVSSCGIELGDIVIDLYIFICWQRIQGTAGTSTSRSVAQNSIQHIKSRCHFSVCSTSRIVSLYFDLVSFFRCVPALFWLCALSPFLPDVEKSYGPPSRFWSVDSSSLSMASSFFKMIGCLGCYRRWSKMVVTVVFLVVVLVGMRRHICLANHSCQRCRPKVPEILIGCHLLSCAKD